MHGTMSLKNIANCLNFPPFSADSAIYTSYRLQLHKEKEHITRNRKRKTSLPEQDDRVDQSSCILTKTTILSFINLNIQ